MIDIKYNTNNRSGLNHPGQRNYHSGEDFSYQSNGFRNSKGLASGSNGIGKTNLEHPIKVTEQYGDSEEEMDNQGNRSQNHLKEKGGRNAEERKYVQESPVIFLDAFDFAYDRTTPADKKFKDLVLLKDVKFEFTRNDWKPEDLKNYKFVEDKADTRVPWAYAKGGVVCKDDVMAKFRSIAKEVIKEFGKKLLTGSFNLTTVSFPIKSMIPESLLEKCSATTGMYPLFLNLACQTSDPLQRFKFALAATISINGYLECFAKPLNPILGETFEGGYSDGTQVYIEQICHHPPISYILVYGPDKKYSVSGSFVCEATGGLNSIKVIAKGMRKISFKDSKQEITINSTNDLLDGTFWGKCVHSLFGDILVNDERNDIHCKVTLGKVRGKLLDYFEGEITHKGKVVSKVTGTYLGWLEIDGNRYWDHRFISPHKFHKTKSLLGSDSNYRSDLLNLSLGEAVRAQREKESLEQLQRYDRKLRKEHKEK